MTIVQVVFDNFNDNSINTALWSPGTGSTLQAETSATLKTPCASSSAPTTMTGKNNYYDLRKGRLGVQMSRSGTTDPNVYTYFGIKDYVGAGFLQFWRSNDYTAQTAVNDAGPGTATQVDATIGLGPTLPANTWLGWRFDETAKTYFLDKSSDGVTWTNIYKYVCTTLGVFNYRRAQLHLGCTSYGTVTNFTPTWDNVTYFVDHTLLRIKTKSGGTGANTAASTKVRVGGVWKRAIPRVRVGGAWSQSV